jgi:hypothetical protein
MGTCPFPIAYLGGLDGLTIRRLGVQLIWKAFLENVCIYASACSTLSVIERSGKEWYGVEMCDTEFAPNSQILGIHVALLGLLSSTAELPSRPWSYVATVLASLYAYSDR